MPIKVKGLKSIKHKLDKMSKAVNPSMSTIGFRAREAIVQRTLGGKDMDGHRFKKYSTSYSRKKGARGGGWLSDTGNMLSSITHKAAGSLVTIFFSKNKENLKAHGHHYGSKILPQRKFFGLSDRDIGKMIDRLTKGVRKAIR